ncbi:MAG TPA: hypothetical protein PLQ44_00895 [Candidatus Paceibacterota bacterium]|nr:hypothetical protein [Candidatus Paceibacterota bacterium]HPT40147.1 hypothetical protein [Candidatus Paceibacterota bacterium]
MNEQMKPATLIKVISMSKNKKRAQAQVTIEGMNGKTETRHIVFNGREWRTAHDRTVDFDYQPHAH